MYAGFKSSLKLETDQLDKKQTRSVIGRFSTDFFHILPKQTSFIGSKQNLEHRLTSISLNLDQMDLFASK